MLVWHDGEEFSIDVYLLLLPLYITQALHIICLSYDFTLIKLFIIMICTVIFHRHSLYCFLFASCHPKRLALFESKSERLASG